MSTSLTELMGTSVASFFNNSEVRRRVAKIACQCNKQLGGSGLTSVTTSDSASVTFTGTGTVSDPLSATTAAGTIPNLQQVLLAGNSSLNLGAMYLEEPTSDGIINLKSNTAGTYARIRTTGDPGALEAFANFSSASVGIYAKGDGSTFLQMKSSGGPTVFGFTGDLQLTDADGTITKAKIFSDGRMQGANAINGPEFITLQQLNSISLTGFAVGANSAITASDTILAAFQKTQGQIAARAPLASPSFTGTPLAPTAAAATNNTQIATTQYVTTAITNFSNRVKKGISTFTADDTSTVLTIPHGLGSTPVWYEAFNLTGLSGNYAARAITVNATNIIITFANPPSVADGNATFAWKAEL